MPKIIALPMSWKDAKPLLENMDGPVAPASWQGGLPIKYRLGGSRVRVHLKVDMDTSVRPNYVVEARIRGSELPDEWIVLGNHRDAWEFGGVNPSSGTASMMELSRALGEMKNRGTRPRRTIVVCSWDGEEVALTGSTEWGEHFADELKQKLVAYINVDSSVSGPDFRPSAVASLAPLILEVSRELRAPQGVTLYAEWKRSLAREQPASKRRAVRDSEMVDTRIGSGSDHTVFLNFLGRPTIGLTFDGPYGVYHSMYDNFYWMNKFGDPGYRYHAFMSVVWGVLALRLANADVLPFDFDFYADNIRQFVRELQKNKNANGVSGITQLLSRIAEFQQAGRQLNRAVMQSLASGKLTPAVAARVNRSVMQVESNWVNPEGIPGRPWFKHMLYAARFTYAHLELPGLTEAVEKNDIETASGQARLLAAAIAKNTALLREASRDLEKLN